MTKVGFLEDKRVEVTKGVKVFDKSIAKTDAEIWLKVQEAAFNPVQAEKDARGPGAGILHQNAPEMAGLRLF